MIAFNNMLSLSRTFGMAIVIPVAIAFAILLSAGSSSVFAQAAASAKYFCSALGSPTVWEPIGDRAGHNFQVSRAHCRVEGGPLDGGLLANDSIWEFDGATGTMLSGQGVIRKTGAVAVFRITAGTMAMTMKDGAPTGWSASGKGTYTLASGGAAALAGKTYSWTARPVGPGQTVQEIVMD